VKSEEMVGRLTLAAFLADHCVLRKSRRRSRQS
jgi:hypothetical protein